MSYKSILCISDLHIPYHHPQAFDFLKALKKKIKPDLIFKVIDGLSKNKEDNSKIEKEVQKEIIELCSSFPIYSS